MSIAKDPAWINPLCRFYAAALWLYPRSHRERWGADMRQVFRDRCREAARSGHGPLRVVFADLLPDLVASVGNEHFNAFPESTHMRRTIYLLLALLLVVIGMRPYLPHAFDSAGHWWEERKDIAWQRDYSTHLEALAQATEQQRHDARGDVAAVMLYWGAAQAYETNDYQQLEGREAERTSAGDALRDHADAVFARALKAGDRWALWMAVNACPARSMVCAGDVSLARLRQIESDNGTVWLLELAAAHAAHDPARERVALARIARSTRYDNHEGDAMRAMLAAFDRLPFPSRFDNKLPGGTWTETQSKAYAVFSLVAWGHSQGVAYAAINKFNDDCRSKIPQERAERAADCRAAGRLLSENGSMYERYDGNLAWYRNTDDADRTVARQAIRDQQWQRQSTMELRPDNLGSTDSRAGAWKAAWLAGGREVDVYRRLLGENSIPLQAPAGFKLYPADIDHPAN
ncbi:MAG: hypothetical protein ABI365_05280 [Lysobacteraceae bacterium]